MMNSLISSLKSIILKGEYLNIYTFTILGFLVWMLFFDGNNFRTQYKLNKIIDELESEKTKFGLLYRKAIEEKAILEKDQERFAREKYYMHKDNEDVFIIEQPN